MNTNTIAATATAHANVDYAKCVDWSDLYYFITTVRANCATEYARAYEDELVRLAGGLGDTRAWRGPASTH